MSKTSCFLAEAPYRLLMDFDGHWYLVPVSRYRDFVGAVNNGLIEEFLAMVDDCGKEIDSPERLIIPTAMETEE